MVKLNEQVNILYVSITAIVISLLAIGITTVKLSKCKKFPQQKEYYSLFEGEHTVSAGEQIVGQKEIFRINEKTGETDLLITTIQKGQRINVWFPVFETRRGPAAATPQTEPKAEENK